MAGNLPALVDSASLDGAGPVSQPADGSLTLHGVTLYGIVDIGLQCDDHSAPFNDYHPAGSSNLVAKDSVKSQFGATPSNLSNSRIGLQGIESLGVGDWFGIFRLETFFNPQSGQISDALKSMVINNGRALAAQSTNLDSTIAGQIFQQSFAGLSRTATVQARTYAGIMYSSVQGGLANGFIFNTTSANPTVGFRLRF